MTNVFDRIAYRLRPVVFWSLIAALPIFLLSYGGMLMSFVRGVPFWVSVPVCLSHLIVWLAASCLHDVQRERRLSQSDAQPEQPALR